MSDPKHPAKLVVVVRGGRVEELFIDKDTPIRIFVADYDAGRDTFCEEATPDSRGVTRWIAERIPTRDTMEVRAIINKRGGK